MTLSHLKTFASQGGHEIGVFVRDYWIYPEKAVRNRRLLRRMNFNYEQPLFPRLGLRDRAGTTNCEWFRWSLWHSKPLHFTLLKFSPPSQAKISSHVKKQLSDKINPVEIFWVLRTRKSYSLSGVCVNVCAPVCFWVGLWVGLCFVYVAVWLRFCSTHIMCLWRKALREYHTL